MYLSFVDRSMLDRNLYCFRQTEVGREAETSPTVGIRLFVAVNSLGLSAAWLNPPTWQITWSVWIRRYLGERIRRRGRLCGRCRAHSHALNTCLFPVLISSIEALSV